MEWGERVGVECGWDTLGKMVTGSGDECLANEFGAGCSWGRASEVGSQAGE